MKALAFLRAFAAFGALAAQLFRTSPAELERAAGEYVQTTQAFLSSADANLWSLEPVRPAKAQQKTTAR